MNNVSFEAVKVFVKANYKHDRLYGRNASTGWDDSYGDDIVAGYHRALNTSDNKQLISRHESTTGEPISFTRADVIQYNETVNRG